MSPFSDVWAAIGLRDRGPEEPALGGRLVQKPQCEVDREPEFKKADSLLLGDLHLGRQDESRARRCARAVSLGERRAVPRRRSGRPRNGVRRPPGGRCAPQRRDRDANCVLHSPGAALALRGRSAGDCDALRPRRDRARAQARRLGRRLRRRRRGPSLARSAKGTEGACNIAASSTVASDRFSR